MAVELYSLSSGSILHNMCCIRTWQSTVLVALFLQLFFLLHALVILIAATWWQHSATLETTSVLNVDGQTVTWVVLEVSLWWLIHPEMTNTQTPQWTVITAMGARGCAADCLLIFIIYGDFYWNAQQQAKNRRATPDLWLLCENKTVLFLFAQHSFAEYWGRQSGLWTGGSAG